MTAPTLTEALAEDVIAQLRPVFEAVDAVTAAHDQLLTATTRDLPGIVEGLALRAVADWLRSDEVREAGVESLANRPGFSYGVSRDYLRAVMDDLIAALAALAEAGGES